MITLATYFGDRQSKYRLECTEVIKRNAENTVSAINRLVELFFNDTKIVRDRVSSGWRPSCVNDSTANAAKGSNHILANAGDIEDLDRKFAQWCVLNPAALAQCGLWMEDPRWTPTWVHLQTLPPKSGKRIYIPNNKPPLAAALQGQKPVPVFVKI